MNRDVFRLIQVDLTFAAIWSTMLLQLVTLLLMLVVYLIGDLRMTDHELQGFVGASLVMVMAFGGTHLLLWRICLKSRKMLEIGQFVLGTITRIQVNGFMKTMTIEFQVEGKVKRRWLRVFNGRRTAHKKVGDLMCFPTRFKIPVQLIPAEAFLDPVEPRP